MQINRYSSSSWHKVFCLLKHLFKQLYIYRSIQIVIANWRLLSSKKDNRRKNKLKKKQNCVMVYNHVVNMVPIKIFQQIYMYDTAMYYDLLNIEYVTIFTKGSNLKI